MFVPGGLSVQDRLECGRFKLYKARILSVRTCRVYINPGKYFSNNKYSTTAIWIAVYNDKYNMQENQVYERIPCNAIIDFSTHCSALNTTTVTCTYLV